MIQISNLAKNSDRKIKEDAKLFLELVGNRPIVLIGMMGAGKTTIGRRLANRLGLEFIDSDNEIEMAAGMSIIDFFAKHGEEEFRKGEAKVIKRILKQNNIVLGTGGGAFLNEQTRNLIKKRAVSIWIKADFDLLFARISKRATRPLLQTKNPKKTLRELIKQRYPIYEKADISVISRDVPHEEVVSELIASSIKKLKEPKI